MKNDSKPQAAPAISRILKPLILTPGTNLAAAQSPAIPMIILTIRLITRLNNSRKAILSQQIAIIC